MTCTPDTPDIDPLTVCIDGHTYPITSIWYSMEHGAYCYAYDDGTGLSIVEQRKRGHFITGDALRAARAAERETIGYLAKQYHLLNIDVRGV